jgi:hypothetical protein
MSFWQTLVLNIFVVLPPFIYLWFKLRLEIKLKDEYKIELEKREAFKSVLASHSYLLYNEFMKNTEDRRWAEEFSNSTINLLLWCSDDVLYEYSLYAKDKMKNSVDIIDREKHFANSIIYFRKELGYKNKNNKITPESIIHIFRIGFKKQI